MLKELSPAEETEAFRPTVEERMQALENAFATLVGWSRELISDRDLGSYEEACLDGENDDLDQPVAVRTLATRRRLWALIEENRAAAQAWAREAEAYDRTAASDGAARAGTSVTQ